MRNIFFVALKTIAAVLVGVPLLFIATCAYTSYSPHLRNDPLLVALMDAQQEPERRWRTQDVPLSPGYFSIGEKQKDVFARLHASGFKLFADYSTDVGPRDKHPGDSMSQEELDKMFVESKKYHNERGITHVFNRGGRARPACGEGLFVEAGFSESALTHVTGYSRWTCL
jgi:hypothetical protein